ncbi:hypothetical protein ACFQ3S_16585 [Mucilaginibacter terrae]|uniref:hypothetical protein n=1 Tax=Mucilaginibacter terrae TaxID=1955052 RepID=UPI003631C117
MKSNIKFILAILMLLTISCKKDKVETIELTGTWRLNESYINSGGGTVRTIVDKEPFEFIQFKENGDFNGAIVYKEYKTYKIKDSTIVILTKADNTTQSYKYIIERGTLTLSPVEPILCIEGCGNSFSRVFMD